MPSQEQYPAAVLTRASLPPATVVPEMSPGCDFMVMPRQMVRFAEVSASGLELMVEGPAAETGAILAFLQGDEPDHNTGIDAYDLVVFKGHRVIAIITRGDGHWPLTRTVEPAIGPKAAPGTGGIPAEGASR